MKKVTEREPSEMGREIRELENKYHEYFFMKRKCDELYQCVSKVFLVLMTMCVVDILNSILEIL